MSRSGGPLRVLLLVIGLAFILVATLTPMPGGYSSPGLCIFCGDRGGSDFLSNVILFGPFGFALAVRGVPWWIAGIVGALLSLGIETMQVGIVTGRDASLGDFIANTLGTLVGWRSLGLVRWLNDDVGSTRRATGAAMVTATILLGGLSLFHPALPEPDDYYMQWRMRFRNMDVYGGDVLSSRIGPLSLPVGRVDLTDSVRSMLLSEPLMVEAVAGPPPERLAPIVSLYDQRQRQVLLLGARGGDLVYRQRARGDRFLADRATIRVAGAFDEVTPGEPFRLAWRADAKGYCIELDGRERCGHGLTVGDTWMIVHFLDLSPGQRTVAQLLWPWLAFIPAGLAIGRPGALAASAVVTVVMFLAGAPILGFAATPPHQVAGAVLGLATGALVGRYFRGRSSIFRGAQRTRDSEE